VTFFINASDLSGNSNTSQIYSYYADGILPIIENITFDPSTPTVADVVNITANVTDNQAVSNVLLAYTLDGVWKTQPMSGNGSKYMQAQEFLRPQQSHILHPAYDMAENMNVSKTFSVGIMKPKLNFTPKEWDFGEVEVHDNVNRNFTSKTKVMSTYNDVQTTCNGSQRKGK